MQALFSVPEVVSSDSRTRDAAAPGRYTSVGAGQLPLLLLDRSLAFVRSLPNNLRSRCEV